MLMRKAIIVICGLLLLLGGLGGLLIPVLGYFYAREWAVFFVTLSYPFFPVFYFPFTVWVLVTGGGLLGRRPWAWWLVQTFWLFLLCTGVLTLVGFNLLASAVLPALTGEQLRGLGNLVLGLGLFLLPVGGLVFFASARDLFTAPVEESPWSRLPPVTEDRWSEW